MVLVTVYILNIALLFQVNEFTTYDGNLTSGWEGIMVLLLSLFS